MLTKRGFIIGVLALAGCSTSPDAPVTNVQVAITGQSDMNSGRPAQVKVYYLKDTTSFRSADFFAVFDSPGATLGDDLVKVTSFQLAPGRTVADVQNFAQPPGASGPTSIGVVAAFSDINGRFLASKALVPGAANPVQITLAGNSVSIR